MSNLDVRHTDPGTEHEYVSVTVGGHILIISERDGDANIYVCDHATVRVTGDRKDDDVSLAVGRDEFPTRVDVLDEVEFQERFNDD